MTDGEQVHERAVPTRQTRMLALLATLVAGHAFVALALAPLSDLASRAFALAPGALATSLYGASVWRSRRSAAGVFGLVVCPLAFLFPMAFAEAHEGALFDATTTFVGALALAAHLFTALEVQRMLATTEPSTTSLLGERPSPRRRRRRMLQRGLLLAVTALSFALVAAAPFTRQRADRDERTVAVAFGLAIALGLAVALLAPVTRRSAREPESKLGRWLRFGLLGVGLAWLLSTLTIATSGCGVSFAPRQSSIASRHVVATDPQRAFRCMRGELGEDGPFRVPLPGEADDPAQREALAEVPAPIRDVVRAGGLEPSLGALLREAEASPSPNVETLARRQAVQSHLASLGAQLDATIFELDCTGDLTDEDRGALASRGERRELGLTVASIIVGAGFGLAAGVWELADEDSRAPPYIALTSGTASAALGAAAIVPHERVIRLEHARNLLVPLVRGVDDEHLYPTFVFRMLVDETSAPSRRARLLARFDAILDESVPREDRALAEAILYGEGGFYDDALLSARIAMLEEVETMVEAMSRDLELVARFLVRRFDAELLHLADDGEP